MEERIKAIITIIVTAAVNIANVVGYAVDLDTWLNAVLSVFSAITIIWSWWKNQNITPEAIAAQKYLNGLKYEKKIGKHEARAAAEVEEAVEAEADDA